MATRKRQNVGRTQVVDRRIRGIGRIRHASGLAAPAQFRKLNDEITEAAKTDEGRALLRMMVGKRPKLRADVFYRAAVTKTLHLIPQGNAALPLIDALTQWREDFGPPDVSKDTYRVRHELITGVASVVKRDAMVAALPDAIRQLRVRQKNAPRSFNLNRSYALAFVRDTIGKLSPVYLGVQQVPVRKVTPKVKKYPLSPAEVQRLATGFDVLRAKRIAQSTATRGVRPIEATGADLIAMALTGMNPMEYAGVWAVRPRHVHIDGTKRDGRVRDIPKVFPCTLWPHDGLPAPSVGAKNYGRWFRDVAKAAGIPATPYDLRRTFANWMESAKIPRTRRMLYIGHGPKDITDLYERHEIDAFLLADGATLTAWLDAQLARSAPEETSVSPERSPDAL